MNIRIVVQEGESLSRALKRFARSEQLINGRPWAQRSFGYYEKPSMLRRKDEYVRGLRRKTGNTSLKFGMPLKCQFARFGAISRRDGKSGLIAECFALGDHFIVRFRPKRRMERRGVSAVHDDAAV